MIFSVAALLIYVPVSNAFFVTKPQRIFLSSGVKMSSNPNALNENSMEGSFASIDEDIARAIDCTDHFGECSVEEMEELKRKIHAKRITAALTGQDHISAAEETVALEQLLLEEDLEVQLALLKDELLPSSLDFLIDDKFEEQLLPGDSNNLHEDEASASNMNDEISNVMPLDGAIRNFLPDFLKVGSLEKSFEDLKAKSNFGVTEASSKSNSINFEEPSFKSFMNDGLNAFMMDESGLPEELVICGAVLLVIMMPSLFHS